MHLELLLLGLEAMRHVRGGRPFIDAFDFMEMAAVFGALRLLEIATRGAWWWSLELPGWWVWFEVLAIFAVAGMGGWRLQNPITIAPREP